MRVTRSVYDPDLDYLTSASYGDGLPSATPTWGYDAAGNRSDSVCDALNRATSVGGVACTNDVLGNRVTKGGTTSYWDPLSRLAGQTGAGSAGQNQSFYDYRADGLRVHRGYIVNGNYGNGTNVRYRYDGQMGFEDREDASWGNATTRYGLGARGVDLIERTPDNGSPLVGFPLYDAHGNNVATLTRSGTGYAVSDRRSYDAWGVVRAQQSGGDPTLRYCASLGHKQDDESGMVYMRARYYEPTSGRFVSEDPGKDRANWFAYCGNDPINFADSNGKELTVALAGALIGAISALIVEYLQHKDANTIVLDCLSGAAGGFAGGFFTNAAAAGAVSAFVNSILGDLLNGRAPRWGRAFAAAGVGGLTGAVFGAVASIGGKNASMKAMLDGLDDDTGQFDSALGVLGGVVTSSAFDTFNP